MQLFAVSPVVRFTLAGLKATKALFRIENFLSLCKQLQKKLLELKKVFS